MTWEALNIRHLTEDGYATEAEACEAFDMAMSQQEYFTVHKECGGEVFHPRVGADRNSVRIDRLLVPRMAAVTDGWNCGAFGVEIKTGSKKVGKVICQALDYMRSLFELPSGLTCCLDSCFIFPLGNPAGELASIMAQQRIGSVKDYSGTLIFYCGSSSVLTVRGATVTMNNVGLYRQLGRKCGSR